MQIKQNIANGLRNVGLLGISDKLRYLWQKLYYATRNRRFKKEQPLIKFPPTYYIYETYRLNYAEYYDDGFQTAKELARIITKNISIFSNDKLLDWGCGPARIVRHIPSLLPDSNIYASDSNFNYINWCKQNIPGVNFNMNKMEPPLLYDNDFFSAVIGLSVFTHLSVKAHDEWIKELHRIIKKAGVLIITTQGFAYGDKLLEEEQAIFKTDKIVVREKFKQGHRLYSAFQPKEAIIGLIKNKFSIAEYIPGTKINEQDFWVLIKE